MIPAYDGLGLVILKNVSLFICNGFRYPLTEEEKVDRPRLVRVRPGCNDPIREGVYVIIAAGMAAMAMRLLDFVAEHLLTGSQLQSHWRSSNCPRTVHDICHQSVTPRLHTLRAPGSDQRFRI